MRISDWSSDVCSSDLVRHRLADFQLAEILQVRHALKQQHALDDLVGVLHLLDRFFVFVVAEPLEAPALPHPRMQEILVDGGQLVLQHTVEVLDHFLVAFHAGLLCCASHVATDRLARSEEHTSELQSLMRISYAVFCLKKKQQ